MIDNFDETVVKKTGDEEITGVKNLKDGLQINGENLISDKIYTVASIPLQTFKQSFIISLFSYFLLD